MVYNTPPDGTWRLVGKLALEWVHTCSRHADYEHRRKTAPLGTLIKLTCSSGPAGRPVRS